jgi:hypothetical protein
MKGKPFKRIFEVLKNVAPTAVAGMVNPAFAPLVAAGMRKVLNKEGSTDAELEEAVLAAAASPADVVKLKEIELEAQRLEQSLGAKFEEIAAADRADARAREVATKDSTTKILAFVVLGAFVAMSLSVLFGYAVAESTIAGTIIGYMSAKAEQVIAYYFGSSAGSKQKTDLLGGKQ